MRTVIGVVACRVEIVEEWDCFCCGFLVGQKRKATDACNIKWFPTKGCGCGNATREIDDKSNGKSNRKSEHGGVTPEPIGGLFINMHTNCVFFLFF